MREEIIGALPVEQITEQLQLERQERLKRLGASEAASSEYPSVPPSVADEDGKSMSSSSFVHASQMAASTSDGAPRPKKSKVQLWQEMKINAVTRALTLVYVLSLLTMFTRIQLNLLGRRTYLSSVVALASPPGAQQSSKIYLENKDDDGYDSVYSSDFETNRKYLTFSWWLLHRGCKQIMDRVSNAVKEVFGAVNIREDMTLERLSSLLLDVRCKVEGATERERMQMKWLSYLLPPSDEEAFVVRQAGASEAEESPSPEQQHTDSLNDELVNGSLRRLLDETSDLIDSPTFCQVLTRVLDAAYSHLVDHRIATEAFKLADPAASEARVVEISDTKAKLAHILPVFCRQAHVIAAGSGELDTLSGSAAPEPLGNEYLAAIDRVHDVEAFAAVIYSSNFESEVAERTGQTAESPAVPAPRRGDREVQEQSQPVANPSVVAASTQSQESTAAESQRDPDLETAWRKALAGEDEKQGSQAPVPVEVEE